MIILGSVHPVRVSKKPLGLLQFTTYLLFLLYILNGWMFASTSIIVIHNYYENLAHFPSSVVGLCIIVVELSLKCQLSIP